MSLKNRPAWADVYISSASTDLGSGILPCMRRTQGMNALCARAEATVISCTDLEGEFTAQDVRHLIAVVVQGAGAGGRDCREVTRLGPRNDQSRPHFLDYSPRIPPVPVHAASASCLGR